MLLSTWFQQIAAMNEQTIRLGLDRIQKVASKLDLLDTDAFCFTVAGTNGKGSTVATLEQIYITAGYKVGTFTSPYLMRFTEQIRINGEEIDENEIISAFECIKKVRQSTVLTPFEWTTLAALLIFKKAEVEILILEVGLGGRLDATNVVNADIGIITSIALDHCEYLGTTRDEIGYEKAGILRAGKPAIYGEPDMPASVRAHAVHLQAPLYQQGEDFIYHLEPTAWSWEAITDPFLHKLDQLPLNGLYLQNLSTALMAVHLALARLPVHATQIRTALRQTQLPGRIECIQTPYAMIYDVAHNPAACSLLANAITNMPPANHKAIFSMLRDKDMVNSLMAMRGVIHHWYAAPLEGDRGCSQVDLQAAFEKAGIQAVSFYPNLTQACEAATHQPEVDDRLVVFGSFHTVATVKRFMMAATNA